MPNYWTPKDYTQFFLIDEPVHTEAEIRREYSRIRDIEMKRANRLEKIGMTAQADYIRKIMPRLSEIKTSVEVSKRLAQGATLYKGASSKAYSITGIKELQKHIKAETGEVVPLGEVLGFNEYMKSWRLSAFSALIVPSAEAASLHPEEYQEIGGSFSNFYTLYKEMES